jgi:hypothetical protein
MNELIKNIVKPENGIEIAIISDADFINGAFYGKVRNGHPEGQVIYHIKEVLENIDKFYADDEDRKDLRQIAIVHDTFKYKVDQTKPKVRDNHHGTIAAEFIHKYRHNTNIIAIIASHDEAYNAWSKGGRHGDWNGAKRRAEKLINELNVFDCLNLYLKFFHCDNATGDKSNESYEWFKNLIEEIKVGFHNMFLTKFPPDEKEFGLRTQFNFKKI